MPSPAKELIHRWFEEVWNQQRDDSIYSLTIETPTVHFDTSIRMKGMDGFKEFRDNLIAAMPNLRVEVEDIIEEGEQAVVRWLFKGKHTGTGFGHEPTDRTIEFRGVTWFIIQEGLLAEGWNCWNQGGVFQQLASVNPKLAKAETFTDHDHVESQG